MKMLNFSAGSIVPFVSVALVTGFQSLGFWFVSVLGAGLDS